MKHMSVEERDRKRKKEREMEGLELSTQAVVLISRSNFLVAALLRDGPAALPTAAVTIFDKYSFSDSNRISYRIPFTSHILSFRKNVDAKITPFQSSCP